MSSLMKCSGSIVLFLGCALFSGCATSRVGPSLVSALPISLQAGELDIRAESRMLSAQSISITVYLVAKVVLTNVRVSIVPDSSALSVKPEMCSFGILAPPKAVHAMHAPYPLPVVPLCSFVATANSSGDYSATLHVENSAGNELVQPARIRVTIKGAVP